VKRRAALCDSPSARIFPGPRGGSALQAINRNLRKVVEAVAEKNPGWNLTWGRGKNGITFHTTRHSYATLANASGMSERTLMLTGNWKSRAMVDRYAHGADDAIRTALDKVGKIVSGKFG